MQETSGTTKPLGKGREVARTTTDVAWKMKGMALAEAGRAASPSEGGMLKAYRGKHGKCATADEAGDEMCGSGSCVSASEGEGAGDAEEEEVVGEGGMEEDDEDYVEYNPRQCSVALLDSLARGWTGYLVGVVRGS